MFYRNGKTKALGWQIPNRGQFYPDQDANAGNTG
jgi:hypothetical protein